MLLKQMDDKSARVHLLMELQQSNRLDANQKRWLREELVRLRNGIAGERDSAYFLDQYFKDGQNHVVLHDLRFIVDGDVAQIDHLILNRALGVYLIETKNYASSVEINERGEFTVDYGNGSRLGVPSPVEQSHRHERIIQKLLNVLDIKGRTGAPLACFHVVMFHPKAVITRPSEKVFDTSNVIKADQFPTWHKRFVDKDFGFGKTLNALVNVRSLDTIKEWGEKLKRQHRPADLLELPEFMKPKERPSAQVPAPEGKTAIATPPAEIPKTADSETPARKLICLHCQAKISFPEGKFCWNNSARFGGGQYCREHQALFA